MPFKDKIKQLDAQLEHQARKREKRWNIIFENLGRVCNICSTGKGPFDTDHIDPSVKNFTLMMGTGLGKPIQIWLEELKKCQLLCRKCHIKKSQKEATKRREHGDLYKYIKEKCRCSLCKATYKTYRRKEYLKRGY